MSREDSLSGTTPTQIPQSTGTHFSWYKNVVLYVTVAGTTTISSRQISMSTSTPTGVQLFWKAVAVASYAQATSGDAPTDSGSNGATPSGYTLMTTSPVTYDASSVSSGSTGTNGMLLEVVMGVDNGYIGAPGTGVSLPTLTITYAET
jgi:hypothetical protein